jgi:hypothetical protein
MEMELGPVARQVKGLIDQSIEGSDLNLERMFDPSLDFTTDDKIRYLLRLLGHLQGVTLYLATEVDNLGGTFAQLKNDQ